MGAFAATARTGRLFEDIIASLYRVAWGFATAMAAALPLGLVISWKQLTLWPPH